MKFAWSVVLLALASCSETSEPSSDVAVPGRAGALKSSARERAARRLFDGAPPVMPHPPMGATCTQCHNSRGMSVPELGFAPPSPHAETPGMSALSRCEQCHVNALEGGEFRSSAFSGVVQDLRSGTRMYDGAPPTIPHSRSMRENCSACHDGPAAREQIRCSHPERARCEQCHVPALDDPPFTRP